MATTTHTLTINAAFLSEIKTDHQDLGRLLEEADRLVAETSSAPRIADRQRLETLLEDLCDQLALHFALEEAFGYFEDAVDVAPRLSRRAETLQSEHGELYAALCDIVELAQRLRYRRLGYDELAQSDADLAAEIGRSYADFHAKFTAHETSERNLMLEALDDEIGGGD